MPSWQRVYLIACSAVIGYSLAYVLCVYGEWPKLTYFPYERAWRIVGESPGSVPAPYLGIVLWGIGGAAFAAAVCWIATRFVQRTLSRRWLHLFGGWALTSFAIGGAFFTWNLWPF